MEVEANGLQDSLESNEIEKRKVGLMRARVESADPSSKDLDDFMIRRFLRARDLDIDKASALLLKYLGWRRAFIPNGYISASEIPNELAQNKLFMQGFVVYSLEKICASMPGGEEKFISIADIEGWGYTNSDIRAYLAALSILQDCYPERLGKLFLVHVPYVFMTAWKVVYPFIDSKTKKKIIFVENKNIKSTLLGDIDENQLPDVYGGKLPLVPIQDS
uniref:CRAL-TRIO domain-containing protein n=1 Tax=Vitis vinifera TaxID=29760 RepID=A5C190_VITVI|nr:hypothetical protein VITISV_037736 [Vitis vinifera]